MQTFLFHKSSLFYSSIQPQPMRCFFCFDTIKIAHKNKQQQLQQPQQQQHSDAERNKSETGRETKWLQRRIRKKQTPNKSSKDEKKETLLKQKTTTKRWKNDFTIKAKLLTKLITNNNRSPLWYVDKFCSIWYFFFANFDFFVHIAMGCKTQMFLSVSPSHSFRLFIYLIFNVFIDLALCRSLNDLFTFSLLLCFFFVFLTLILSTLLSLSLSLFFFFTMVTKCFFFVISLVLKQRKHIQIFIEAHYCNYRITYTRIYKT